jgi:hypothetical protein
MTWNASNLQVFVPNVVGYSFDDNKRLVKHETSVDGLRRLSRQPFYFDEDVKIAASWNTAEERLFKSPWLLDEEMQAIEDRGSEPHMEELANELLWVAKQSRKRMIIYFNFGMGELSVAMAATQCFYEYGDPNVYGRDECLVEDCANTCAVTSDGRVVTCISCAATLCSECVECDDCVSAREEALAEISEEEEGD